VPTDQVWLFAGQGLRGPFPALSGAGIVDLVALETWLVGDEKRDV